MPNRDSVRAGGVEGGVIVGGTVDESGGLGLGVFGGGFGAGGVFGFVALQAYASSKNRLSSVTRASASPPVMPAPTSSYGAPYLPHCAMTKLKHCGASPNIL